MADRVDFYYRQRVTEAELDQGDAGLEQAAHRRLERPQGFETSIRALHDVAGEEHRVDALFDGAIDDRQQRGLGREGARIYAELDEILGQAGRARPEVNVTDGEERELANGWLRIGGQGSEQRRIHLR